jgi:chromosome partitioning protein
VSTSEEGLRLVPNNILLSGIEFDLASRQRREYVLRRHLESVSGGYDICVIDCSPSLSLLTLNALVASTDVVIPVQTHYYALEGLRQLLETIQIVKERFNDGLKILGVLLTFVEKRTMLSKQVQRQMRDFFGDLVFDTVIHRTVRLAEAPSAGQSVLKYAPQSKGAAEYIALADEIINGKPQPQPDLADDLEGKGIIVEVTEDETGVEQPNAEVSETEQTSPDLQEFEQVARDQADIEETNPDEADVEHVSLDQEASEQVNLDAGEGDIEQVNRDEETVKQASQSDGAVDGQA